MARALRVVLGSGRPAAASHDDGNVPLQGGDAAGRRDPLGDRAAPRLGEGGGARADPPRLLVMEVALDLGTGLGFASGLPAERPGGRPAAAAAPALISQGLLDVAERCAVVVAPARRRRAAGGVLAVDELGDLVVDGPGGAFPVVALRTRPSRDSRCRSDGCCFQGRVGLEPVPADREVRGLECCLRLGDGLCATPTNMKSTSVSSPRVQHRPAAERRLPHSCREHVVGDLDDG